VSSWLDHRQGASLWYRIDSGDQEPETLFHFLGLALPDARRRHHPLPRLTPEYLSGLREFTRRYFRDFFDRLRMPCALVFDNCHEAGAGTPLETILAWALQEAPAKVTVVCVSRKDPGSAFAQWLADARFLHVTAADLRLQDDEARAIALARGSDAGALDALLSQVDGWVAGLVLLLRSPEAAIAARNANRIEPQPLFDYFAGEIMGAMDPATRELLVRTALVPVIPAGLAVALTGMPDAPERLADLHRNHFFTERRAGPSGGVTYEYHPLFRRFLLAQGVSALAGNERRCLCRKAAALLEESDEQDAAADLRIETEDWPALTRQTLAQAPILMSQGRWRTLARWISSMPTAWVLKEPWLLYWRGACYCMVDPPESQHSFEAAHRGFRSSGNAHGCLLACAGVLEARYFQLGEQRGALPWIDELDRLLAVAPPLSLDDEIRVIQGLLGVWMAQPQHPMLPEWAARSIELIRTIDDSRLKAGPIALATGYQIWTGDFAQARLTLHDFLTDRQVLEGDALATLSACFPLCPVSWQHCDHEEALQTVCIARRVADASGVRVFDSVFAGQAVYTALSMRDVALAREELDRMGKLLQPHQTLDSNHYHFLNAAVLLLEGNLPQALQVARHELAVAEELGAPFIVAAYRIQVAQMLVLDGAYQQAVAQVSEALNFARAMPSHIMEFQALMVLAWASLRNRNLDEALGTLRRALEIGRRWDYMNCHPLWIPEMAGELFEQALAAGIETTYVKRFIRKRKLDPVRPDIANWPWQIRIYTMGRFEIRQDDVPLASVGKGKQRVLTLLKAIIAHGQHGASMERIAAILWPDTEGDAARDDLRVALHRLRRLLADEQAVITVGGRIQLNQSICWVDAFALEQAIDDSTRAVTEASLALYAGQFLQGDGEQPWLVAPRDRLRSKFHRAVEICGTRLEQAADLHGAIDLYLRAIETDPLAEMLYRRVMLCYARQDRRAEALATYRRCRQMLSVILGISPGADTELLRAELSRARRPSI
jgi:DNA-binding SARP family transcriptional activator